ncbi:fungal-specific transcription factor domain-containing protein [Stachybotrys elegans]|uniref:Fungal-specific transcription factor domain-containing protein n=1 Tax=Stachybotrys elegans TaxID=80388 RepID=A0A8K0SXZ6_9HYPO|nr:fungal-specific transcription factor domain-containing protein [Stachybotrys elegans]
MDPLSTWLSARSFLSMLFSDGRWRKSNAGLLRELIKAAGQPEASQKPCSLPSASEGSSLVERYLSWAHVMGPFLLRREVWELHSRVYADHSNSKAPDAGDLFRIFMIYALASIIPYRNGLHHQHPEGYYMAALQYLDSSFLARGMRSLEDLLLICRYGIYENIGTSIWDIVQLGGRLCIELELHAHDGPPNSPPIEKQRRRRVFWKFYLLDRYCSSTLDRPFAIDDRDIRIGLPADIDDHLLETWDGPFQSLDSVPGPQDPSIPTETTFFLRNVTLRQVSSHIHTEFSHLREECATASSQPHLTIGRIYMILNQLLEDLENWRAAAPAIANPTCIYHLTDWSDFLYAREKLYLVRRAVDLVPRRDGVLPKQFAALLLHASLQVIKQYSTLCQSSLVTHTRNYFHMMFTAGLSVIYCVSSNAKLSYKDLSASAQGLRACEATLTDMAVKLVHSNPYVTVYAALHRDVSHRIQRALMDSMGSSRPCSVPSSPNGHHADRHVDTVSDQSVLDATIGLPFNLLLPEDVQLQGTQQYVPSAEPFSDAHFTGAQPMTGGQLGEPASLPAGYPRYSSDTMFPLSSNELSTLGDDLLHWARTDDSTLRTIDTTLLDYIYGDPNSSGASTNAFMGGF